MAVNNRTFLKNLRGKQFNYSDDFYRLKGKKVIPSNSFSYYLYDVMHDIVDFKTNNFSNLFLSKKMLNSDWLEALRPEQITNEDKTIPSVPSTSDTIITMIAFSPHNSTSESNKDVRDASKDKFNFDDSSILKSDTKKNDVKNSYLYFQLNSKFSGGDVPTSLPIKHTQYDTSKFGLSNEQFQMSVNFIDSNNCTISHTFGDTTYYLAYGYTNIWSTTEENWSYAQIRRGTWNLTYGNVSLFWMNIKDGYDYIWNYDRVKLPDGTTGFELYTTISVEQDDGKVIEERYYVTRCFTDARIVKDTDGYYHFSINEEVADTIKLQPKEYYKTGDSSENRSYMAHYDNATILKMPSVGTYGELFTDNINQSFIKYNRANIIGEVNAIAGLWNIPSQTLLHHEYNNEKGINFIPLKNQVSYQGNTILGHYQSTDDGVKYTPDENAVDFREYTSINSGFNQEHGLSNISLSYIFSDQEYEVNQGEDIIFNTEPLELKEQVIPIQDCAFIDNGAFGSDTPWFADKFKMLQNDPQGIDNGTYLCTWLRKENLEDDNPQWMDRYYNPTSLNDIEALQEYVEIEQYSEEESYTTALDKLSTEGVADFPSKVVIKDKTDYKFSRLSKEMVDELITSLDKNIINVVKNQKNKKVNLTDGIRFDTTEWRRLEVSNNENISAINFNTDILIHPDKHMGIHLFGSSVGNGFTITNRTDVTPYLYYSDNECVYLLNNKWEVSNKLNFKENYNDTILKVLQGDLFEDIVVISPLYLYLLSFDLRLKSKMCLVDNLKEEDDLAIYNLTQDGVLKGLFDKKGKPLRLLNYPYGDNSIENICYVEHGEENIKLEKISVGVGETKLKHNVYKTSTEVTLPQLENEVLIESNVTELLAKTNSILYKNNIYIPYGNDVLKIIFSPDTEEDFDFFTEEIRKEYPAACRKLNKNEYHKNFFDENEDETTVKEINSIYIDEDSNIFAFNFDYITMSYDKDTIFGMFNPTRKIDDLYTIYTQPISNLIIDPSATELNTDYDWMVALESREPQSYFVSQKSFDMFKTNEDGFFAMVFNKETHTENNEDIEFRVYNKNKELKFKYPITNFRKIVSLESFNYIDSNDVERKVFTMMVMTWGSMYKIEYDCLTGESKTSILSHISTDPSDCFVGFTNNVALLRNTPKNCLYFTLNLPTPYLFNQPIQLTMPLDEFVEGWYNINVSIDLIEADFTIRLNDNIYKQIFYDKDEKKVFSIDNTSPYTNNKKEESRYRLFRPFAGISYQPFNHSYYLGTTPKKYGFTMNDVLKNGEEHDPYTCKNAEMENTIFITKALSLSEYQAMRLRNKNINKIILTLPCNRRSSTDEITRLFRYSAPSSMSNSVKIIIDGHGLSDKNDIQSLKNEIYDALDGNIDAIVRVNNIEFLQQ